ncbi:hypothetical protein F5B22DRAFT_630742 [Xylaria bambusicola]|uniref:uncharacterized protein n=1 Tax=Xylaria bambusicola TaxID=326684 RepID=UPI002007C7A3|nr:uncharacterized protein F5B22DRAFT_630742 [Xylaria bambusicola]KAI0503080.1 hypothetical protein F5B22DRAFT_630742 [Xylaria bambusicola]
MKIDEIMVHKKDMCDIIDTRLQQGGDDSLSLLRHEVLFKQIIGSDERNFEAILTMLKS